MNREEVDRMLRQTLEDHWLSRGEKRVLEEVFEDLALKSHDLDFLRSRVFEIARTVIGAQKDRRILDWIEGVVKVLHKVTRVKESDRKFRAYFEPGDECPNRIVELFSQARLKVDVCVFTITHDFIATSILAAHNRGVAVRIISDDYKVQDHGSDIIRLAESGIPVRIDKSSAHMHHKFAIFDGNLVLTGSYNWTRSAAEQNLENIVVLEDPGLARAFQRVFDELWEEFG